MCLTEVSVPSIHSKSIPALNNSIMRLVGKCSCFKGHIHIPGRLLCTRRPETLYRLYKYCMKDASHHLLCLSGLSLYRINSPCMWIHVSCIMFVRVNSVCDHFLDARYVSDRRRTRRDRMTSVTACVRQLRTTRVV